MGMDVFGNHPTSKTGEYFRNNCWWWRPLADYAVTIAPEITSNCEYWQSNDGDGLNADDSIALADALQAEVDSGRCDEFAEKYKLNQDLTPDEPCRWCDKTGIRSDGVGVSMGMVKKQVPIEAGHPRAGQIGWCNACNGKGTLRPSETEYPFSVENVQEFIAFLRTCGGFRIDLLKQPILHPPLIFQFQRLDYYLSSFEPFLFPRRHVVGSVPADSNAVLSSQILSRREHPRITVRAKPFIRSPRIYQVVGPDHARCDLDMFLRPRGGCSFFEDVHTPYDFLPIRLNDLAQMITLRTGRATPSICFEAACTILVRAFIVFGDIFGSP